MPPPAIELVVSLESRGNGYRVVGNQLAGDQVGTDREAGGQAIVGQGFKLTVECVGPGARSVNGQAGPNVELLVGCTVMRVNTFDMLQDVRRRLGFRLSLAHLAGATIGAAKSADGLQSLQWVKEGRMDLVEEYCRRDVEVTKDPFFHGLEKGWLRYRDKEERLMQLAVDWDLRELAAAGD